MPNGLDPDPQNEVTILQAICLTLGISPRYVEGQTEVVLLRLVLGAISVLVQQEGGGGGGTGDMTKAVYDPDNLATQLAGANGQGIDAAAFLTALGATTVGKNLFTIGDPGAIAFARVNANNSITLLSASDFRTAIGAGISNFSGAYGDLSGLPTLGSAAAEDVAFFQEAMADASQAEMEAGLETALRAMSPLRVAQAIVALAPSGAVVISNPVYTWNAIDASGAGTFISDDVDPHSATTLAFNVVSKYGSANWRDFLTQNFLRVDVQAMYLQLTSVVSKKVSFFRVSSVTAPGGQLTLSIAPSYIDAATTFSGDYEFQFVLSPPGQADWNEATSTLPTFIANKPALGTAAAAAATDFATAAQGAAADSAIQPGNGGLVPADTGWTANADAGDKTAAIPTMPDVSALEAISTGFGAWADAMDKKLKAVETALAAALRPNA